MELAVLDSYFFQVYNVDNSESLKLLNLEIKIYARNAEDDINYLRDVPFED